MARHPNPNIKHRILAEVIRLSGTEGFANFSTRDLAKNLGISEPVVFTNFKTKEDLINAAFMEAWAPFDNLLDPLMENVGPDFSFLAWEKMKPGNTLIMAHPGELAFLKQYFSSPIYFDLAFIQRVQAHFLAQGVEMLRRSHSLLPPHPDEIIFLAEERMITSFYQMAWRSYLDRPRSRRMGCFLFSYGLLGAIVQDQRYGDTNL
jgi:AcrR family transcriptional regulator